MWLLVIVCRLIGVPKVVDLVDLTETIERARPGGGFWALIESDDEELVEQRASTNMLEVSKDTGQMKSPELKSVTDRPRSKVQLPPPTVKPWIGPIPKVIREPVTLLEFIPES